MNRLSNMTRFGFNQERPIFWASSLELIGDWLDVQIELLFNIFRFLGTPGWDAQAVTWILVKNMCWDINFQLKNGCLMLWKTTLDLTLGWEWWKSKDQRHGQIAVWGLTCGLKRWPSKTTPWSILGAKTNDHRGVEICDSHNKTNQNPPIKEAVDQSIWKVKLFVPARGTSLESVICRFFVLTVKRVCCISGGFIGMIFKKWSEMIQKSPNESPVSSVTSPRCATLISKVSNLWALRPSVGRAPGSPTWRPWSSGCVAQGAVCWAKGRPRFNTKMAENQAKRYQQTLCHLGWTYIWMQQIMWGFLLSNLNLSSHQWHNLILWYHPSPSHEGIKLCFKDLSFDQTARFTLAATWWSSLLWWR